MITEYKMFDYGNLPDKLALNRKKVLFELEFQDSADVEAKNELIAKQFIEPIRFGVVECSRSLDKLYVKVPFTGNTDIFYYHVKDMEADERPFGNVYFQLGTISFSVPLDENAEKVVERNLFKIKMYTEATNEGFRQFNAELKELVNDHFEKLSARIEKAEKLFSTLVIPQINEL